MDQMAGTGTRRAPHPLRYRTAHLGLPGSWEPFSWTREVAWTAENIARLRDLGFNTVQLNVAWGSRPGDNPLNLEDVVALSPEDAVRYPQPVLLRGSPDPNRWEGRRRELRERIALCRAAGMRTVFHFGAPYNAHARYGDNPPNCISDPAVAERYALLIQTFAAEFPGVDDLHVYTYDQDAWLCSEFGDCPRCAGIPLHQRLVPLLNRMAAEWRACTPDGTLWWEPWELSAGQSLECIAGVSPNGFGLALHVNAGECMATIVVDRWFRNMTKRAESRGIPVIAEYFLGAGSEETEPLAHLAHPLTVLRGLKAITSVPGVCGIKEYYGLAPEKDDPNLQATALFFTNPEITEEDALIAMSCPYGPAAEPMRRFWSLTSQGMDVCPWEVSWYIREIGRSAVDHSLAAATIHGQQCSTPSWDSTRHSVFMKVDDSQPHPWMLEDVQLRFQMAADLWRQAEETGVEAAETVPAALRDTLDATLRELAALRRRVAAYAFHLRETNLATVMRRHSNSHPEVAARAGRELGALLVADRENWREEKAAGTGLPGTSPQWPQIDTAIELLRRDTGAFLDTFFLETPYQASKGIFTLTSR